MASPVDTTVKFYREDFPGAPVLNGVAGSLIDLLDACLCTGFGLRSRWQDDTLLFERPGANGDLAISEEEVILTVHLGFLLSALKPSLEREIQRHFDTVFGA